MAVLAVAALALAGCGRSADPSDGAAGAAASDASVPAGAAGASDGDTPSVEPVPEPEAIARLRQPWTGDLDAMVKRRILRALVTFNRTNYFIDGGQPRGITSELLREFEEELNSSLGRGHLRVHVVAIPVRRDELFDALAAGRGDIAAAGLTATAERRARFDFASPLATGVRELVVTAPGSPPVAAAADLAGREIFVRASSAYFANLRRLSDELVKQGRPPIEIRAADELLEDEDLLEMVHAGLLPATVVDEHYAELWRQVLPELQVSTGFAIAADGEVAWAVRNGSPKLLAAASRFARGHGRGTLFGNVVAKRYLKDADYVRNAAAESEMKRFRGLVGLFRKYAGEYDFDWLMVAAQGYQESQLDQAKRSRSGAVGVMQLLPSTAADKMVGIPDISSAANNIHAGVKYLRFLSDRYFDDPALTRLDRQLFAFAAYNAGPARVAKLRRQAEAMGLDPDVWFRNVEVVAAREIGRETVQYVSNIYKYYVAYRRVLEIEAQRQAAKSRSAR